MLLRHRFVFPARGGVVDEAAMTAQLVTDTLGMAIWRRGRPDALLHRSDRGSHYTSEQFQRLMADNRKVC
jgi:putative transposase